MKKMKKLNLNKVRIVSLRNVQKIYGGSGTCPTENCTPITTEQSSTGDTEPAGGSTDDTGNGNGNNGSGTYKSEPTPNSFVLTECELIPS